MVSILFICIYAVLTVSNWAAYFGVRRRVSLKPVERDKLAHLCDCGHHSARHKLVFPFVCALPACNCTHFVGTKDEILLEAETREMAKRLELSDETQLTGYPKPVDPDAKYWRHPVTDEVWIRRDAI